jgi:hypothetical protein
VANVVYHPTPKRPRYATPLLTRSLEDRRTRYKLKSLDSKQLLGQRHGPTMQLHLDFEVPVASHLTKSANLTVLFQLY